MTEFKWPGQERDEIITELEQLSLEIQDPALKGSTAFLAAQLKRQRDLQIALAQSEAIQNQLQSQINQSKKKKFLGLF